MTARPVPARHWRSYGDAPLPSGREALDEPFGAFPSWFMRMTCDRCGKDHMLNEVHTPERQRNMPIRVLLAPMRHGRSGRVVWCGLRQRLQSLSELDATEMAG